MPKPHASSQGITSFASMMLMLVLSLAVGSSACSDSTGPSDLQGPPNLWRPNPSSLPASGNYVVIESQSGDAIGLGLSKVFQSPADSMWAGFKQGRLYFGAVPMVNGAFGNDNYFSGDFIGPSGKPIAVGYFGGLERWPFNDAAKGGFSVTGTSRGCNTLSGWFAIDKISFADSTISALDLRFEQHCDGAVPALHGAIHWSR